MHRLSLQDRLDTITARTRKLVQPERLAPGEQAVAELFASGIEDHILPVGASAPEFALEDGSGRLVRSTDLLALGPLVIDFFRGRWCSYCVNELEAWRAEYESLRLQHALLIAISPQTARQNEFTATQHELPFPVLADPGAHVAEQFGLVYTVPPYLQRYYRSILVNIPFMNGEPSYRLPLPATYVVAQDSTILFAKAHADFRVRPEPVEALAALPA
ncbi:AhpC/TSA family protein [Acidipila sp. EB88]|nr:peroxiredoxin-like family protein [Acidipila sp. EB88]RRA49914.1 AhpC/TSA family protein [Acidipila sp. EB88]